MVHAFCCHRSDIMEGPTSLWWGDILTISLGEAAGGTPLGGIASSRSGGSARSAMGAIVLGVSGVGHR
ncbi:uracil/xanthine transporter, partial [Salmonella enterica subsp. enterica serovar Infantis]